MLNKFTPLRIKKNQKKSIIAKMIFFTFKISISNFTEITALYLLPTAFIDEV